MKKIRSFKFHAGIVLFILAAGATIGGTASAQHSLPGDQSKASQQKNPAKPATKPIQATQPPSPPKPVVLPDPPIPVVHVQQLGLTSCVNVVRKMSNEALDRSYSAQSGWNRETPAKHVFQSVAVLNNPQSIPQDGLVALTATPTADGSCDGVTLQVFPLAKDCANVQKAMQDAGSSTKPMNNALVMTDRAGKRLILLPGANNTCVAVAVDSTFGDEIKGQ